jgi:hypothetical protein
MGSVKAFAYAMMATGAIMLLCMLYDICYTRWEERRAAIKVKKRQLRKLINGDN